MKLGIIGGTALEALALGDSESAAVETPWGEPSAPVVCGRLGRTDVRFIGRHGPGHVLPPHRVNYRANIAALMKLEVEAIVALNTVGGITAGMEPGRWVLPHQLVDYTWGRAHTFADGIDYELLHVDFGRPYSEELRQSLARAAGEAGVRIVERGVFGVTQGPRLETAAEIERMERDGCDLVGMTGMPEAALAREAGIPYASLCLVVNPAAGKSDREITMGEIREVIAGANADMLRLLEGFCRSSNRV